MEQLSERLQTPISTAELERRWAAVRAAMERDKIDVLLMQNNSDQMGGYVKYFTDLPATNGYPLTVVFPRDDLMTLVSQGPFGRKKRNARQVNHGQEVRVRHLGGEAHPEHIEGADRPVRARMSWTKVIRARLTISLVTTVAMISRCSGWVVICGASRCRTASGK